MVAVVDLADAAAFGVTLATGGFVLALRQLLGGADLHVRRGMALIAAALLALSLNDAIDALNATVLDDVGTASAISACVLLPLGLWLLSGGQAGGAGQGARDA